MKLRILITLIVLLGTWQAKAQLATPDRIATSKGPLTIQPVLHGSVVFSWDGKSIYVDPYGGAAAYQGLPEPDFILITDIHGDHMDTTTLGKLNTTRARIIAPQAVADKLPAIYQSKITVLRNGESTMLNDIKVAAIPMYNLPPSDDSRHTKGRGNGYILQMGGKTVYLSGDTEDIPEMRGLRNIDVAFVCMNLPYTMDINQASDAVLAFTPKVVYPYHYRGQNGFSDVEAFKKMVNDKNKNIEVRLRNWYPQQK